VMERSELRTLTPEQGQKHFERIKGWVEAMRQK
jgi:hypothetical protein